MNTTKHYHGGQILPAKTKNQIRQAILAHQQEVEKQRKKKERLDEKRRYCLMGLLLDLGIKPAHNSEIWDRQFVNSLMGPSLSDLLKQVYGSSITKQFGKK